MREVRKALGRRYWGAVVVSGSEPLRNWLRVGQEGQGEGHWVRGTRRWGQREINGVGPARGMKRRGQEQSLRGRQIPLHISKKKVTNVRGWRFFSLFFWVRSTFLLKVPRNEAYKEGSEHTPIKSQLIWFRSGRSLVE